MSLHKLGNLLMIRALFCAHILTLFCNSPILERLHNLYIFIQNTMNYTCLHYIRYYMTEIMLSYNVRVRSKTLHTQIQTPEPDQPRRSASKVQITRFTYLLQIRPAFSPSYRSAPQIRPAPQILPTQFFLGFNVRRPDMKL